MGTLHAKFRAGAVAALLLCAGAAAAQDADNAVIGPPQLKDFRLQPRERIVVQQPQAQPEPAQPQPQGRTQEPTRQPAQQATPRPRQAEPVQRAETPRPEPQAPASGAPPVDLAAPVPDMIPAPVPEGDPAAAPAETAAEDGTPWWMFALPGLGLAFLGVVMVRRRRRRGDIAEAAAEAAVATKPAKPAAPAPRPWLELELRTERASFTDSEAVVAFELGIRNTGRAVARNLRIDVKMFNAGREQDQAIGAFFRTAGRETTRLTLPGVAAGAEGWIRGEVAMPREEMRAVRLDEKLLFIPVVAVNTLYDHGQEGRTGQTSRSYVVGRELQEKSDKMGPFRVDQGPRVWRTVGQRPHKVTRRV